MLLATPEPRSVALPATITGALLMPQDRIPREPLEPWARHRRERLAEAFAAGLGPVELAGKVAAIANNTALIATHRGLGALARALCEAQFRWLTSLARTAGAPVIRVLAVQPWVNMARLDALEGAWERSLSRLALVEQLRAEGQVVLEGVRIGPDAWDTGVVPREAFLNNLDNLYVIDSLKALLSNARYGEILEGVIRAGRLPSLAALVEEARVVAACRSGCFALAEEAARAASSAAGGWRRVVFQLRLAETLGCAGDPRAAAATVVPVAAVLVRSAARGAPNLNATNVLARAASLCMELQLHSRARALAEGAYAGACAARDEALRIEALRILVRVDDSSRHTAELDRLQHETAYPRLRRPGAPDAECPESDALFLELAERLAGADPP